MGRHKKEENEALEQVVKLEDLQNNYNVAVSNYTAIMRKMVVLNAVDNTKLWQVIGAKFPKYQILPDSNWVSYIKQNIVASLYTVAKSASLLPTCDEDREAIEHINVALDYIWDTANIGYYQMQAGDNAALYNTGITQVGWDNTVRGGKDRTSFKGNVVVKNINPLKYMRDPFAESLDTAAYVMTWDDYHKSVILANPAYKESFNKYLSEKQAGAIVSDPMLVFNNRANAATAQDYYKIFTHFVRYINKAGEPRIAEIHTVNNEYVLFRNDDILPRTFPFVELFCNLPNGDVVGTSEPAKVLSNNIAYNIVSSMMLTAEYRNQNPPKFISSGSGLNLSAFTKHANDADYTFIVHGDATRAVHYHQFPSPSPAAASQQGMLIRDMQATTGIDDRYTGRDTGSIITTGGVEGMLDRVTLIDAPKILNYEAYAKKLTQLVLANFIEFSMKRTYFKKDLSTGKFSSFEVDYEELSDATLYNYAVHISSELPKNKQRVASMANMLMEKQMQYGGNSDAPELITPEEWLELQDLPIKEMMLKRMHVQRLSDTASEIAGTLFGFSDMVKQGVMPDDAIAALAENTLAQRRGETPPNIAEDMVQPKGIKDLQPEMFEGTEDLYEEPEAEDEMLYEDPEDEEVFVGL